MQGTVPGLNDEENYALAVLQEQLADRFARNYLRACYYDGKNAGNTRTAVVPDLYYDLGIVLGWTGKAVDLLARRCRLDGIATPGVELDTTDLVGMLRQEVASAVTESLISGVSWLVTSSTTSDERALGAPPALVQAVSGMDGTGWWDNRLKRLVAFYQVHDREANEPTAFSLWLMDKMLTFRFDGSRWHKTDEQWSDGVPVEPMVYKPRAGRMFGRSRITRPMMAHQDQGVRELIRLEGHMDVYSYPEMFVLGADESIFADKDGNPLPKWQVMLGRIKFLPDDEDALKGQERAQVQQFGASSPEPHLAALNAYAKLFAREASLPDTSLAITDLANPTSAEAYDSSQYELIAEAEGATADWSLPVRRTARRLLVTAGLGSDADFDHLELIWRSPRYLTRSAQADAGLKTVQALPFLAGSDVGLELMGLTRDQIDRVLAERGSLRSHELALAMASGQPLPASPYSNQAVE